MILDLYIDIEMEDWDAVGCNFDLDVVLINDQGICVGRTDVQLSEKSKFAAFGNAPESSKTTVIDELGRVLYTQNGNGLSFLHGVATYLIVCGQIQRATDHGVLTVGSP